jgi:hypothetical protein
MIHDGQRSLYWNPRADYVDVDRRATATEKHMRRNLPFISDKISKLKICK